MLRLVVLATVPFVDLRYNGRLSKTSKNENSEARHVHLVLRSAGKREG